MSYNISPSLSDLIHSSNSRSLIMAFWVNMFTICSVLPDFFMWVLKESACSVGDPGSIPGLGKSPGEGVFPYTKIITSPHQHIGHL